MFPKTIVKITWIPVQVQLVKTPATAGRAHDTASSASCISLVSIQYPQGQAKRQSLLQMWACCLHKKKHNSILKVDFNFSFWKAKSINLRNLTLPYSLRHFWSLAEGNTSELPLVSSRVNWSWPTYAGVQMDPGYDENLLDVRVPQHVYPLLL